MSKRAKKGEEKLTKLLCNVVPAIIYWKSLTPGFLAYTNRVVATKTARKVEV